MCCKYLIVPILLLAAPSAGAAEREPLAPQEKTALFNGRDLAGWTTWLVDERERDPRAVFTVKDGEIRISGDGYGYLATKEAYRDYRLTLEYRWGKFNRKEREKNARDSGLFLHAVGPDGNSFDGAGAYKAAIECQIMQGAVGDFLLIKGKDDEGREVPVRLTSHVAKNRDADGWPWWQADGERLELRGTGRLNNHFKSSAWRDTLDFRGEDDVDSTGDKWTKLACTCREGEIEVRVNGRLVNHATGVHPAAGQILLQCEGSEIYFRSIELSPLE